MMLAHHLFYDVADIAQLPIKYDFVISSFDTMNTVGFLGKMCVSIFTFISGYGIAKSLLGRQLDFSNGDVYGKLIGTRFIKLLLSFQFIFILSMIPAVVAGNALDVYGGRNTTGILYMVVDFLGLANIIGTPTYNGTWWYMSYALMLVVILPFVVQLCRQFGSLILVLEFFLVRYLAVDFTFRWHLLATVTGVVLAENHFYERLMESYASANHLKKAFTVVAAVALASLCVLLRWSSTAEIWDILEAVFAATLGALVCLVISNIPVVRAPLEMLGKHSMNIFMTHTFIYYYWFREHIYSFQYPLLILLMLVVESLVVSVALEYLKKLIHFEKFSKWMCNVLFEGNCQTQPHVLMKK